MRSPVALRRAIIAFGVTATLGGCAQKARYPAMPAPHTLPEGSPLTSHTLERTDAWLRHYVMAGAPDSAARLLSRSSGVAPRDELLRRLQLGLVLHHAGRFAESNAAFAWAEAEAERRYTRSVTRSVASLAINDAVIDYVPPPPELAMVPYHRMLNYLQLGDPGGAQVEARKAAAFFARLRDALPGDSAAEPCVGEGLVHHLGGLVFQGAGAANDALVSFRQAERAYRACGEAPVELGAELYRAALQAGVREVADSAASRYGLSPTARSDTLGGMLIVLVEHGWIAHRADEDIHVPVFPEEVEGLSSGDTEQLLASAAQVGARLAANLVEQAEWGDAWDERPEMQVADALAGSYIMKLAWPTYRLEACSAPAVRVVVDGAPVAASDAADVSGAVLRRWEAQRGAAMTRMVARGMVKYLAVRELEKKARKQGGRDWGEVAEWVTGRAANLAGNRLERADTRSWSLLPDRVSLARIALAPGSHPVRIEVLGADGQVAGTVDLGVVTIQPGETAVRRHRVWGTEKGDLNARRAVRAPIPRSDPDPAEARTAKQ